jgi:hypothetical protein
LIGIVFLLANILIVANWIAETGIAEKAGWVRKEFLTGTAIAIIVALLILLVNSRNAGSKTIGLNRLQYVIDCYTRFFNEHRPHQGIGNIIPSKYNLAAKRQGGSMLSSVTVRSVAQKEFLGGLLKSYQRAA